MIFSEVYGVYFKVLEKILKQVIDGKLDDKALYEIVKENAFSESAIFIEDAIKSEDWQIIDKNYKTPYQFVPKIPLTELEKRYLKAILQDKKISLFIDFTPAWLGEVTPLFNVEDFLFPDRFRGGDDFQSENYRKIFKTILCAIKQNKKLKIEYISGKGQKYRGVFIVRKMEYSQKEDKFRIYTGNIFKNNTINIGRITKCELFEEYDKQSLLPLKISKSEVEFIIINERNCLERALIHFSSYEKETIKLDRKTFKVKMKYNSDDETEILIRLLQFGQLIKVISPDSFVKQIKTRIFNQKSCDF